MFISCLMILVSSSRADEIDDLQSQIDALNKAREQSISATKPLQSQLVNLKQQLSQIQANINSLSSKIVQKENDLKVREEKVATQQVLLDQRIRSYYIRSYSTSPLYVIFSSQDAGKLFQELTYRQAATAEDQRQITNLTNEIVGIVKEKDQLEKDKQRLASFQSQLDQNATFLNGEITKAQAYQSDLSSQIASLSAKQQALIAAKLAALNIPLTAYAGIGGGCSSDLTNGKNPGFSPAFGLFTYGVPNRVGLNQYGAKGRAEQGQSAQKILSAYYNFLMGSSNNPNIHVVGTNNYGQNIDMTLPLEDYLKHIYEMPASWHPEALKAQAIAARSYVLSETHNGANSICPSDHCQEFKQELNAQTWIDAVNATSGQVMTSGGQPITAWFSSTHGGYVYSSGGDIGGASWTKNGVDTTTGSVSNFSDLQSNAYDKASPWFYCDWGSRSQYGGTAWLTSDEMADIVNAILLAPLVDETTRDTYLVQTDTHPSAWSPDTVKQKLRDNNITPFNSVSAISVSTDFGAGRVNTVNVSGDAGSKSISGSDFKNYFNLRAPANIQIVGPLFNAEKR